MSNIQPNAIANLSDEDFKSLVDDDIRGRLARDVQRALREDNYDRWYQQLSKTETSMRGQFQTMAENYEQQRSTIAAKRLRIEAAGGDEAALLGIDAELEDLRASYAQDRRNKMRFVGGLQETITVARIMAGVDESLMRRVEQLEAAIRDHRSLSESQDMEPTQYDRALWALV